MQLSVFTSGLDHIAELLEATKKITRYFKQSYKHNKTHHSATDSHHASTNHNTTHSDKHKCKSQNTSDQGNEIFGQTCASKNIKSEPEDIKDPITLTVQMATLTLHQTENDYHELMKLLRSSLVLCCKFPCHD